MAVAVRAGSANGKISVRDYHQTHKCLISVANRYASRRTCARRPPETTRHLRLRLPVALNTRATSTHHFGRRMRREQCIEKPPGKARRSRRALRPRLGEASPRAKPAICRNTSALDAMRQALKRPHRLHGQS